MKPETVLPSGSCLFKPCTEPGLDGNISRIFSLFRVYCPIGDDPRLYYLTDPGHTYTDPATSVSYISYLNLQLGVAKKCTFYNVKNILYNTSESTARSVHNYYRSAMALLPPKKVPPSEESWLERQWNLFRCLGYGVLPTEPYHVSFRTDEYTLAFVDRSKIVPGPMPTWYAFMSQMNVNMRPVFAAYVWAALDRENEGRQLLFVYDKKATGKTGKSSVGIALRNGLLEQVTSALNEKVLENEFGFAQFYGKRLLIQGDCQNPKILKNDKIHAITGGDMVSVVYKGQMAFTARMHARIIVMSNDPPNIEMYRGHEKSRLICIELDASKCTAKDHYDSEGRFIGNNGFIPALVAEIPQFLYYCQEVYPQLCPNRREILVPEMSFETTVSDYEDHFDNALQNFFEVDPSYSISAYDMYSILGIVIPEFVSVHRNHKIISQWKSFLESHDIHARKIYGARTVRVFLGIRKKGGENYVPLSKKDTVDVASIIDMSMDSAPESAVVTLPSPVVVPVVPVFAVPVVPDDSAPEAVLNDSDLEYFMDATSVPEKSIEIPAATVIPPEEDSNIDISDILGDD